MTLISAMLQALRTADQRRLVGQIGNNGGNLARYAVGAPIAMATYTLLLLFEPMPGMGLDFLLSCVLGGLAQILGTSLLLHAIRAGSFAVGTTLAKTEAVQAALFSAIVLGEHLSPLAWVAIAMALAGVLLLSAGPSMGTSMKWVRDPAALAGLASAACFALSGVFIRGAALSLDGGSTLMRAIATLAAITGLQVLMLGGLMALTGDRGLVGLVRSRTLTIRVGLMSVVGSAGWFFAMTLAPVAQVRSLAQAELVFTVLLARFRFGERLGASELAALVLMTLGVVLLLLSA